MVTSGCGYRVAATIQANAEAAPVPTKLSWAAVPGPALSASPSNAKVVRTAARMAEAFHSGFTALFVETSETKELKGESLKRLRDNMRLAEQLGAQITTVYGDEPAVQIAEYARVSGITKIVVGRTNHNTVAGVRDRTLSDKLANLANDIDIYIIPDSQPLYKKKFSLFRKDEEEKFRWVDLLKTLLIISGATLIGFGFYSLGLREANIITVYILGVLLTAVCTHGHLCGVIASLCSVVLFNYFFTVPRFSLVAADPDYPVTFFIMLIASIMSCTCLLYTSCVKRQTVRMFRSIWGNRSRRTVWNGRRQYIRVLEYGRTMTTWSSMEMWT